MLNAGVKTGRERALPFGAELGWAEKLWTVMPAAYILKLHAETFRDFPPRQAPPDFNPGAMLEHAMKAATNGV
jgi:hypothetical protein